MQDGESTWKQGEKAGEECAECEHGNNWRYWFDVCLSVWEEAKGETQFAAHANIPKIYFLFLKKKKQIALKEEIPFYFFIDVRKFSFWDGKKKGVISLFFLYI